jgi:DNA-directed RNA polymerase subunit RPC12/RpoP
MGVETIGEALSLGWRVVARCVRGREDGPASRSSRECTYRRELDLETLVCTRGRAFALSRLDSRLRCPPCGNRRMVVMFEPPTRAAQHEARGG